MSRRLLSLIGLCLVSTLLVRGCSSPSPEGAKAERPNMVLIVMDTTRQDHMSLYGHKRATNPFLEKLSEDSRVFKYAYSTTSWTSPAHASLFTGLMPIAHQTTQENHALWGEPATLAEILSAHDYETIGIAENSMLAKSFGFHRGFSKYDEAWKLQPKNEETNIAFERFESAIEARDATRPFFIFVNFIEPHAPFDSSGPFKSTFVTNPKLTLAHNHWQRYFLGTRKFSWGELQHLKELYDAEILYVDYWINQMIETLRRENLWEDTVFIVTSDHGENIGDHDMMGHVFALQESLIRIPLLIHDPKHFKPGSRDYRRVQLHDLFPTVLDLAGIDPGEFPSQGHSLLRKDFPKQRPVVSEYYYPKQALGVFRPEDQDSPQLAPYRRRLRTIIRDRMKFVCGGDGRHELYDLKKDPKEQDNRIDDPSLSATQKSLQTDLNQWVKQYGEGVEARSSEGAAPAVDEQTLEHLRTLGYLR